MADYVGATATFYDNEFGVFKLRVLNWNFSLSNNFDEKNLDDQKIFQGRVSNVRLQCYYSCHTPKLFQAMVKRGGVTNVILEYGLTDTTGKITPNWKMDLGNAGDYVGISSIRIGKATINDNSGGCAGGVGGRLNIFDDMVALYVTLSVGSFYEKVVTKSSNYEYECKCNWAQDID